MYRSLAYTGAYWKNTFRVRVFDSIELLTFRRQTIVRASVIALTLVVKSDAIFGVHGARDARTVADKHGPRMRVVLVINFMISGGRAATERFTVEERRAFIYRSPIASATEEHSRRVNDYSGHRWKRARCIKSVVGRTRSNEPDGVPLATV